MAGVAVVDMLAACSCGVERAVRAAEDERRSVAIDKRADSNQVTMPPQRRADDDLAICGCYEVD